MPSECLKFKKNHFLFQQKIKFILGKQSIKLAVIWCGGIKKKARIIGVLAIANVPTLLFSISLASELVQMFATGTTSIRAAWTQVLPNGTARGYGHLSKFLKKFFLIISAPLYSLKKS